MKGTIMVSMTDLVDESMNWLGKQQEDDSREYDGIETGFSQVDRLISGLRM